MKKNYNFLCTCRKFSISAFCILFFAFCFTAAAQCPNFTNLNSGFVTAYTGSTKTTPFATAGLVPGRHTLITTNGTDPRTGNALSLFPPLSAGPVVKLGNEQVNYEAEALVYRYMVTVSNAILLLKFAVVLEDPGHPFPQQPRFVVRVTDPSTITPANPQGDLVEECAEYDVTAGGNIPGFQTFQPSAGRNIRWRDWTTMSIDLSKYVGQQVDVQFITYDCGAGAHFGYCYFTAECMSNTMEVSNCGGASFELEAPEHFDGYLWSPGGSNPTDRISTFNTGDVGNSQITCTVTSDMGCEVTFYAYITNGVTNGKETNISATICEGQTYQLYNFDLPPQLPGQWFYQNVIVDPVACESEVVNLTLTVTPRYTKFKEAICHGSDYTLNGFSFIKPSPGVYRDTVKTGNNGSCDLFNVLELIVNVSFSMPNLIQGAASPCSDELFTYFFIGAETLTSFSWEFPDNAVVVGSKNKPQVTLYFTDDTPGTITLHGKNGCGSGTASFLVTPRQSYSIQINEQICQGDVFDLYNFNLGVQNEVGLFVHGKDLKTSLGCDSSVMLVLNVLPTPVVRIEPKDTVLCASGEAVTLWALTESMSYPNTDECENTENNPVVFIHSCGYSYLWTPGGSTDPGITVTPSLTSTYTVTVTTDGPLGCSAAASQTVIVDPGTTVVIYDTICHGQTYSAYGITETTTDVYYPSVHTGDCDIDIELHLFVRPPAQFSITEEICAGKRFTDYGFDFLLLQEGAFIDTVHFISSSGCDSLVIFNLNVLPQKTTIVHDTVCQYSIYSKYGFSLGKQYFTGLQSYTMEGLATTQGCDSTVILKLFVHPAPVNILDFGAEGCDGSDITFNNWSIFYDDSDLSWEWYLDDSPTPFSTTEDATLTLTTGTYDVTLKVISKDGCTDEITKEIKIAVCNLLKCIETKGVSRKADIPYTVSDYTLSDATWDVISMPPPTVIDSILYFYNGLTVKNTLSGATFPIGVWTVTVVAYSGLTSTDTCEFIVTIERDCPASVADNCLSGITYTVTKLVGLCWTENLQATQYEGCTTDIPWAKQYPGADVDIFGLLYTWYSAVNVPEGNNDTIPELDINGFLQGICPAGYHLPSRTEWNLLLSIPSEDLKSTGYWLNPPGPGNDKYGWDARPAGEYSGAAGGKFIELYGTTGWWAVEDVTNTYADSFFINYYCNTPQKTQTLKTDGLSVRCILDY